MVSFMTHSRPREQPGPGIAFLLTQLGTVAAARFAERVAEHGLTPPQCGVLRLLRERGPMSQQTLAETLRMLPSQVVLLVDELEYADLVRRVRDDTDRRRNALQLTDAGTRALQVIGRVSRAHEQELVGDLSVEQRETLKTLLAHLADAHGLVSGVHPGYRTMRKAPARR